MKIDARKYKGPALHADVCIIGAGAAGISIALQFLGTSKKVVLLESGDMDYQPESQDLYAGKTTGIIADSYLTGSRLRRFGGTTNHWGGFAAELDPVDFEQRDWIPESGWPIAID